MRIIESEIFPLQNGLDMRSNFIKNCDGETDQVIRVLPNSSVHITQKCEYISNVCIEVRNHSTRKVKANEIFAMSKLWYFPEFLQSNLLVKKGVAVMFKGISEYCDKNAKNIEFMRAVGGISGFKECGVKNVRMQIGNVSNWNWNENIF